MGGSKGVILLILCFALWIAMHSHLLKTPAVYQLWKTNKILQFLESRWLLLIISWSNDPDFPAYASSAVVLSRHSHNSC